MLIQNPPVGIPEKGQQAAAIGYARLATLHGVCPQRNASFTAFSLRLRFLAPGR